MTCALTGRSPVRSAADDDFELQSKRTKVTCALTGRSPVRSAADDDFEL